uniref:Pecanex-like protein n=1 Tax=Macrostomum lignano TaxID=282301 RepID=A0A1I8HEL0_9PLAT
DSMIVTHLAPRPASFRRSQRRASHCSSAQGGGLNNGCSDEHPSDGVASAGGGYKSPNRLSINNGGHGGQENDGFRMDELAQPEQAAVAAAEAPGPEAGGGEHRFL